MAITITFTSGFLQIYIWQIDSITYYNTSFTQSGASVISWPITIERTGHTAPYTYVYIYLASNLSGNTDIYFNVNTYDVKIDGQNHTVTINPSANYAGLVQISNNVVNKNIYVQNLGIIGNTGLTISACGWFFYNNNSLQYNIVRNCYAINCYSTGPIGINSGGIFGDNCSECTARNCYSTGTIAETAGGIFGYGCSDCTAADCYSVGQIIGPESGGIFGKNTGNGPPGNTHSCLAINCYSTGTIGQNSGGIFALGANNGCSATNCYSTGTIGAISTAAGGIFGPQAGNTCNAVNCYSTGTISSGSGAFMSGGIFASNYDISCAATNCYTSGLAPSAQNGIYGGTSTDNSLGSKNYSEANNTNGGVWNVANASLAENNLHGLTNVATYPSTNPIWLNFNTGPVYNIPFILYGTTSIYYNASFYSGATSASISPSTYTNLITSLPALTGTPYFTCEFIINRPK